MTNAYLLRCGKLFDGVHDKIYENMEVLVIGKYIENVGRNLAYPEGTEIIDLSEKSVTPGMIDAHVHLGEFDLYNADIMDIGVSKSYRSIGALKSAQRILAAGFTTVRHLGTMTPLDVLDVKRAINDGLFSGPRILASGHALCTVGSQGDISQNIRNNMELSDYLMNRMPNVGCGAEFFANAVRRERKSGADVIKLYMTGGIYSAANNINDIQMNDAELEAIVTTARDLDIPVTAHAYGAAAVKKLLEKGVRNIEHGTMMDEEAVRMVEESGAYVVPTFDTGEDFLYKGEKAIDKTNTAFMKFIRSAEAFKRGRQLIVDSNIKIGYGTDLVRGHHHHNWECGKEYWCYLTHGIHAFRALKAATSVNAEICRLSDKIGTLEPGKYADISAWDADLLTDPYALTKCVFVMKEGVRYETEYQYGHYAKFEDEK